MFRSTDNGWNWTAVNTGLPSSVSVGSFGTIDTIIFAGTWGMGIYRSTNGGTSWDTVSAPPLLDSTAVRAFTVIGTYLFAGTWNGVFRSTDNGINWTDSSWNPAPHPGVHVVTHIGTTLFAGTPGAGVYRSTDYGSNWTPVNNGLTNGNVIAFAVSGTNLFAGTGEVEYFFQLITEITGARSFLV